MRHNADGTKQLDHKGAELLLKIVAMQVRPHFHDRATIACSNRRLACSMHLFFDSQDKQIQALDEARMPPPAARGAGGR